MRERRPRLVDPGYLKWLRRQPCACGCLQGPPCDAAHIRAGSIVYDKPITGIGRKPDDKWALPLTRSCHIRQHAFGSEVEWWSAHSVDPFSTAIRYYKRYGGTGGVPAVKTKAKRRNKGPKRKIASRPFPKRRSNSNGNF